MVLVGEVGSILEDGCERNRKQSLQTWEVARGSEVSYQISTKNKRTKYLRESFGVLS